MLICAATGNAGKLKELRRILQAQGHTVKSQSELGITLEPEETGSTFAQNALIKARAICEAAGMPTVADDSGLCVEALGGAPGVYSARYCGRHGDDEANNQKLLRELRDVPEDERAAAFESAVCFYLPGGEYILFSGRCPGRILQEPKGANGFGYDPLFAPDFVGAGERRLPNTAGRSYAELADDEKDAISHRGAALREMQKKLPAFLQSVQPGAGIGFERNEKFDGDKLRRTAAAGCEDKGLFAPPCRESVGEG